MLNTHLKNSLLRPTLNTTVLNAPMNVVNSDYRSKSVAPVGYMEKSAPKYFSRAFDTNDSQITEASRPKSSFDLDVAAILFNSSRCRSSRGGQAGCR